MNQDVNETIDIIFVVGEDSIKEVEFFENYCIQYNLTGVILGDGIHLLRSEDINELPKTKNLIISGHGSISTSSHKHTIALFDDESTSQKIINQLQRQTAAENILVLSCYSGKIIDDIQQSRDPDEWLNPGSNICAPSPPDEFAFQNEDIEAMRIFMKQLNKDNHENKTFDVIAFIQDAVESLPVTFVYGHAPLVNDKPSLMESCTIRQSDRVKDKLYADSENFTAYLIANYLNLFIKELINDGKASALRYSNSCVLDENQLPQTDWKEVKIARSHPHKQNQDNLMSIFSEEDEYYKKWGVTKESPEEREYKERHQQYRFFLLYGLMFKNKANELRFLFEHQFQIDSKNLAIIAQDLLKQKFQDLTYLTEGDFSTFLLSKCGEEIQVLIDFGAHIFEKIKFHEKDITILDYVIQSKNYDALKIMSKSNQIDHKGYNTLDHVILYSHPDEAVNMINVVLDSNPDIEPADENIEQLIALVNHPRKRNTPLNDLLIEIILCAIEKGDFHYSIELIQKTAIKPQILLNKAIEWRKNDIGLIQTLLQSYAKPNAVTLQKAFYNNSSNKSALFYTVFNYASENVKINAFLSALKHQDLVFADYLIHHDVNVQFALNKAIKCNDIDRVHILLQHYTKPTAMSLQQAFDNIESNGPLIFDKIFDRASHDVKIAAFLHALKHKNFVFADYLIQKGIYPGVHFQTALNKAIEWQWNDIDLIQTLLQRYQAKPDIVTMQQAFFSVQSNREAIFNLVFHHADNAEKMACYNFARQNRYDDLANYIQLHLTQLSSTPKQIIPKTDEENSEPENQNKGFRPF